MYRNSNDYELLYLISENDEYAYNDMYAKYKDLIKIEANKIYSKCKYLGINREDLYQAGLCGFSKALTNFDVEDGTLFFTYANTYINRELQTFVRDKSRNKHGILSDSISLDKELDDDGNTLSVLIAGERSAQACYDSYINYKIILDIKYSLSFFYSQVYELRLNNFTNKEIAILLDVKYKTIDNAVTKIKPLIKKELNKIELF